MAAKAAAAPRGVKRPKREIIPDTPDAIDIAMVAAVSGKPLPETARRVLERQADLLNAQCDELRLRQVGETVRAVLWGILAIAAFVVVALIATVIVHAARSDALLVQSFRVPPAMASQGLTGEVVASEVLDKLAEMQARSESTRAASSYDNNWGDDLKIDIPNTGATADQVWRLLRGWLGRETRISGEVIQGKEGLALTARVGSSPGQRFVDADSDLDKLVTQAAELIYAKTQPYRYSIYLGNFPDRKDERLATLLALTHDQSPSERKWAFNGLSVDYRGAGDFRRAIYFARRALAIDPKMIPATNNLGNAESLLGHDQAAAEALERSAQFPVESEYDPQIIAANVCRNMVTIAMARRDPPQLAKGADCMANAVGSAADFAPYFAQFAKLMMHDPSEAAVFVDHPSASDSPVDAALNSAEVRLLAAIEGNDRRAVADAYAKYDSAFHAVLAGPEQRYAEAVFDTQLRPFRARALLAMGRTGEAAAMIAPSPPDCYECLQVRGLVARATGDRAAAQRRFFEAAKQDPRLPAAFAEWGRLLAEAGHYGSAEVKLRQAAKLAPSWADPLKYWGDMLRAEGKPREAAAKYAAALKLAPNWRDLREAAGARS